MFKLACVAILLALLIGSVIQVLFVTKILETPELAQDASNCTRISNIKGIEDLMWLDKAKQIALGSADNRADLWERN
jgi:hypothetical protein